ncbi:hypothetical protein EDM60_23945 [Brevibacillus parabrevis]|nr:hypothetical protein EDM60_23945 [Brevibacillus parabrevis]
MGILLQAACFGFGLYGWLGKTEWALYVTAILLLIILLLGVSSGQLTNGLITYIIFGVFGAFFTTPWWHGAVIANAIVEGFQVVFMIIMGMFMAKKDQEKNI